MQFEGVRRYTDNVRPFEGRPNLEHRGAIFSRNTVPRCGRREPELVVAVSCRLPVPLTAAYRLDATAPISLATIGTLPLSSCACSTSRESPPAYSSTHVHLFVSRRASASVARASAPGRALVWHLRGKPACHEARGVGCGVFAGSPGRALLCCALGVHRLMFPPIVGLGVAAGVSSGVGQRHGSSE